MVKRFSIIIGVLLIPIAAMAAGNDVTLTTSAVIKAGGYTFNVSGSSAVIQSITVNTGNFTVTLASGSSITISQPSMNQITNDTASDVTASECDGSASSLTLAHSGAGTVTNTISASPTVCSTAATPAPSAPPGGGGSSGGSISPAALTALLATSTVPGCPAGYSCAPEANASSSYSFQRNLTVGSMGSDVKALQEWLNTNGYIVADSGPGSPGNETDNFGLATQAALAKFQKAAGISPAVGYFGPLTRKAVNPIGGAVENKVQTSVLPPAAASGGTFSRDLTAGSTGADVRTLQKYLNSHGYIVAGSGPGSPGNETDMFGSLTKAALAAFQKASGISPAVGYFGPLTRSYIEGHP